MYVAALTAAVAALWVWFKNRSDACERDRKAMWKTLSILSGIVHAIKNCPHVGCALKGEAQQALDAVEAEMDADQAKTRVLKDLGVSFSTVEAS